ncbi:MAG: Rpn family recombination-promoting nuclease/putative transposase [Lachnospiraceae bacterium]|nr:Rpn family recombination-promoting nuclease/putative transposase [Lachnospiraceae bacterium]
MGKANNAIVNYLSDKKRFADMINAEVYGGRQVIKPEGLTEISATTYTKKGKNQSDRPPKRRERRGDLAMVYEDGTIYRMFLTEAQNKVMYLLPVRSMDYLVSAYKKQLDDISREHERRGDYGSIAEQFSGLNKADKLKPVYLLWVYHGEEKWDGAESLKDMVDLGNDKDGFSGIFQDFKAHIIKINEMADTEKYNTELKSLLDLLRIRSDKTSLRTLVNKEEMFYNMDEETYETASVLLNAPYIWRKRRKYRSDTEGRTYDMCKALRDWEAEITEEKNKIIDEQNIQLEQKNAQLEQQNAQLEQKDAIIDSLEKKVAMLEAQLAAAAH